MTSLIRQLQSREKASRNAAIISKLQHTLGIPWTFDYIRVFDCGAFQSEVSSMPVFVTAHQQVEFYS